MKGIVTIWNTASSESMPPESPRPMQTLIAEFPIKTERDVKTAVQRARLLATLVDLPAKRKHAFGRAVAEISRNSVHHSGGGQIRFRMDTHSTPPVIEVVVTDNIHSVQEIQAILALPQGPDCGLLRASAAADQLVVETVDDQWKQIRIGMVISDEAADLDESDIADWAGILRTRRIHSALGNTQRRSRELAKQLASIQRQRQELAAELERSRSMNEALTLLSLVASKTDNAVVIMDADGLITWVNDAFVEMTGYAIQDASGARPDKLLGGPATARDAMREIEQAFQLGHGVSEEFQQYHRDGRTSWISLSLTPIHDDDGRVTRWIGIGSDINKRKEAERALQSARDAAENASKLKGEFLANVSHEIRTPMNAIIGMTDLTLCSDLDTDQREYLSTVKQSAESLLELLNDVLDLSKIEAGRLDLSEEAFVVRTVISNTLKPLAFVAEQKGLALAAEVGADVPDVIVSDPLRLRQILVNLVGNAIKFTSKGSVEITVQQQWEADGEAGLEFIVADTGVGIPASKLDRIFEAFSQADASITRDFGGTGLGLTITSQLLRLMNGRVWVQSEVGKGSRFHFTLRCRLPTSEQSENLIAKQQAAVGIAAKNLSGDDAAPLQVLVADDHPANRQLIGRILEKRGHSVRFARNGLEVMTQFAADEFDVILMDVQMPEMDGHQATAAIRERERLTQTHVPIIAVTAHAMQGQREECLAAGMDAYLSKPVKTVELLTLIDSLRDNEVNVSATSVTSTGIVALEETPDVDAGLQGSHRDSGGASTNHSTMTVTVPNEAYVASSTESFARALERLDNDEELLREQMQFFLKDGPELLKMLNTAIVGNDHATARIAAHRLKNLCATFDDNNAAALCGVLESRAAGNSPVNTAQFDSLSNAVHRLLNSIRAY